VLIHLREGGPAGSIEAVSLVDWSNKIEKAGNGLRPRLEKLRKWLETRFEVARERLTPEKWRILIGAGSGPAESLERLAMLIRVLDPHRDGPKALELDYDNFRNHGQLITLPDGMPFTIKLLFPNEIGGPPVTDFDRLPEAFQLLGVRLALDREKQERRANPDRETMRLAIAILREYGFDLEVPDEQLAPIAKRIRDRLRHHGLQRMFPNQNEKRLLYSSAHRADADRRQPRSRTKG
jgi:hypothetical protein